MGEVFKSEYKNRILDNFDFNTFIENLENVGASRVVLFCVEERPEACHRSIVSNKLQDIYNYKVSHI